MKFRRCFLVLCCLLFSAGSLASAPQIRVKVTPQSIHVEADYMLYGNTLALFNVMSLPDLPKGQVAFISNLKVTDANGKMIAATEKPDGDWQLASGDQAVRVSYDVATSHGKYRWPAGEEEIAYTTPEGLFFTGYALFIVPADKMDGDISVQIELPKHWQASTPWLPDTGKKNAYRATTRRDLLSNAMFFGSIHRESIRVGDLEMQLALGKPYLANRQQFNDLFKTVLERATALFGSSPKRSHYLVIINEGASGDGGAFEGSFSQLINGPATDINRTVWGYVMSHEIFHFWNGLGMVPASEDEEWFKEGVTDYMTTVLLHRAGLFDEAWLNKRLEFMQTRYAIGRFYQRSEASLQQAGHDKQPLRTLVYGGGALVAIKLEADIRDATDGKRGIDDLLRAMYEEFGKHNKPYAMGDIVRISSELSGKDQGEFFKRHVAGNEYLRIEPSLQKLGLTMVTFAEETTIARTQNPSATEARNYQAVFKD